MCRRGTPVVVRDMLTSARNMEVSLKLVGLFHPGYMFLKINRILVPVVTCTVTWYL
jgi:hypothetical protein